ncbi:putative HET-domain-containing protein [Rosellinia necatrix]|uniref:Putative HET-domain-containing protein n=1 Tax=Rosellinia necatrix TaxID=77044 RepID=A0A1S8A848_ROSNE|nr:putative HET-domain-containing protein [Rosellinia necatrix]
MLRWHREDCQWPQVHYRTESIDCHACGASLSHQSDLPDRHPVAVSAAAGERSCLNLAWPCSVEYSRECVARPSGEDLGQALINYLGAAPNNEPPDARYGEKPKRAFPTLPSEHHIRVLQLTPSRRQGKALHGKLEVQDLHGRPYYEALSCTWADDKDDATLSGRLYIGTGWDVIPITKSCSRALRRLRLENADRPIWVGAICINQLSNADKSHQIRLMKDIYTKSIRCIVDIGEPSSDSDAAIDYINSLEEGGPTNSASQQLVTNLFNRKYFRRVWSVQEISSAPNVQAHCGSRSIDWRILLDWVSPLPAINWVQRFKRDIPSRRQIRATCNDPGGLLRLLRDTVDLNSPDPRDKIFALLGLVRGLDSSGITADYDLTYAQVYTGLAAYFIQHYGLAKLIVTGAPKDTNLPSWVPNWRALQESHWAQIDKKPQDSWCPDSTLWKTKVSVLGSNSNYEGLCPITQTSTQRKNHHYRPEIHGQTGALIHEASCLFSLRDPAIEKRSPTVHTKFIWGNSRSNVSQLVITTLEPVINDTDIIAQFPNQDNYIHLRKTFLSAYRIMGEAAVLLCELSDKRAGLVLQDNSPGPIEAANPPIQEVDLFTDFVTMWCDKVPIASELWQIFMDPTGSGGVQAKVAGKNEAGKGIPCMFYYRTTTLEEVHGQYLSLTRAIGDVEGVLKHLIGANDTLSLTIKSLIECVLYWKEPQSWEELDSRSQLAIPRSLIDSGSAAWVNANIIRQRWLAVEAILRERYMGKTNDAYREQQPLVDDPLSVSNASTEVITKIWKDLTANLTFCLNNIGDVIDVKPFSFGADAQVQNESDHKCEEYLNEIFAKILYELGKRHLRHSRRRLPVDYDQAQVSPLSTSSAQSPGAQKQSMDILRSPSMESDTVSWRSNSINLPGGGINTQRPICSSLGIVYDAISWKEHWRMPRSRGNLKTAIRLLGVTTYGDRRRVQARGQPNSRRRCQVLGSLLNLSLQALRKETIIIV